MQEASSVPCSICRKGITSQQEVVTFPDFLCEPRHPLHRHTDRPMHQQCLIEWEHAEQFLSALGVYLQSQAVSAHGVSQAIAS